MNNTNILTDYESQTTKEELISRMSKRLAEAEGRAAFCRSKIENGGAYLGDVHANLAQYEAQAKVAREILNKLI